MARHPAIADVGATLTKVLQEYVVNLTETQIALVSPAETETRDGTVRLGLYLYQVTENGELRNRPSRTTEDGTTEPAPYALDLHYLLTAYPPSPDDTNTPSARAESQHLLLGRAMQVLHEHAVLRGSELRDANQAVPPSLSEDRELRISVETDATETITNIWNTFPEAPFQPSIPYLVGPVVIEASDTVVGSRVSRKTDVYHVISEEGER